MQGFSNFFGVVASDYGKPIEFWILAAAHQGFSWNKIAKSLQQFHDFSVLTHLTKGFGKLYNITPENKPSQQTSSIPTIYF